MKYRIVTNGKGSYKIQQKGFFFGWNDYTEDIGWGCETTPTWRSLGEARYVVKCFLEKDREVASPWVPVDD